MNDSSHGRTAATKLRAVRFLAVVTLSMATGLPARALERLEPAEGCYLGVNLSDTDSISRLSSRLGLNPAVYVRFFAFPLGDADRVRLDGFLSDVRRTGGIALLTLEPFLGLDAVTDSDLLDIGSLCAIQEAQGIGGIMIRFAHEMNGNWYPWGQQPALFKVKFRRLAQMVRPLTSRTALLWAPAYGGGYPFAPSGLYRATPGTQDFEALDTDGDGVLSQEDDMYEPFYPGDDAVDWVGMTLYHWGISYPWLENELPEPNCFAALLTGNYIGGNGDQTAVPNFYARYCADGVHKKPLAIPETAAFFNPRQPGPDELAIKRAWWRQVFNISGDDSTGVDVATHFPKMKCVNWFDHYKPESEAQGQWIDWRISACPPVRAAFVREVRAPRNGRPWFLTSQEFECLQVPDCIKDNGVPAILPLTGPVTVRLITEARTNCDLVVDLLDQDFRWQGGTRAAVAPGTSTLTVEFPLHQSLEHGSTYRWSIFLTPPGSDYPHALAWYRGPAPVARAIAPSIRILGFPPVTTSPSTITVKVKYSATEPAVALVKLVDGSRNLYGSGAIDVGRGDGLLDIPVALPAGMTSGRYTLTGFLSLSATSRNLMAQSGDVAVQVAGGLEQDLIQVAAEPAMVPAGEVFRFVVSYAAVANRDLHVDLFTAGKDFVTGVVQPVGRGSGVACLAISHPDASPGEYFSTAFMTPPGQAWPQASAWSAGLRLTVLEQEEEPWTDERQGLFRRADADVDGSVELNDAIVVLGSLFLWDQPLPCDDAGDVNDDGEIHISDAVFLLRFLFSGGPRPPIPGPYNCGPDPTPVGPGCASYPLCR